MTGRTRTVLRPVPKAIAAVVAELAEPVRATAVDAPIWDALAGVGGRVTVDLIRSGNRYRVAGEFANVPDRFLRRPSVTDEDRAFGRARLAGNVDAVAEAAGLSEADLLEFLATDPARPRKRPRNAPAGWNVDGDRSIVRRTRKALADAGARYAEDDVAAMLEQARAGAPIVVATEVPMAVDVTAAERQRRSRAGRKARGRCLTCPVYRANVPAPGQTVCYACNEARVRRAQRAAARNDVFQAADGGPLVSADSRAQQPRKDSPQ